MTAKEREALVEAAQSALADVARPLGLWDAFRSAAVPDPARRATVLGLIDTSKIKLVSMTRDLATRLGKGLRGFGSWPRDFLATIGANHVAAGLAAAGTAEPIPADLEVLAPIVERQAKFFDGFRQALATGKEALWAKAATGVAVAARGVRAVAARVLDRAAMYADALWGTAQAVVRERMARDGYDQERRVLGGAERSCAVCPALAGRGWRPIGSLPEIGDSPCGSRCRCHFEYRIKGRRAAFASASLSASDAVRDAAAEAAVAKASRVAAEAEAKEAEAKAVAEREAKEAAERRAAEAKAKADAEKARAAKAEADRKAAEKAKADAARAAEKAARDRAKAEADRVAAGAAREAAEKAGAAAKSKAGSPPHVDTKQSAYKEHSKYIDKEHADAIAERARDLGISPDEYRARVNRGIKEAVDHGEFYIRVDSGTLPLVIRDGRFKSQFETGTTNGSLDPTSRIKAETAMFGTRADVAPEARPIYGYVSRPDYQNSGSELEGRLMGYGDAVVRLKPGVRDRATVTMGDSLVRSDTVRGVPAANPDLAMAPVQRASFARTQGPLMDPSLSGGDRIDAILKTSGFIEAQYHGGVGYRDIADVAFNHAPSEAMQAALAEKGIPWRVTKTYD